MINTLFFFQALEKTTFCPCPSVDAADSHNYKKMLLPKAEVPAVVADVNSQEEERQPAPAVRAEEWNTTVDSLWLCTLQICYTCLEISFFWM